MPRNKDNPKEFIAGALPQVKFNKKNYFIDGRMKELRNVNDFMDKIKVDYEYDYLPKRVQKEIYFECYGDI